jgi:drug/metabolite transporter (DMT)-like permease
MKKSASYLMIIIAAAAWGVTGLFVNALRAEGYSLSQIIAVRSCVTAAAMAILTALTDRKNFKINPRDIWMFGGTGIVSFTLFSWSYFAAIGRIGMGPSAVLLYTAPLFIMLLSRIIWKEPLTARKLTAVPLAIAGCVCVSLAPLIAKDGAAGLSSLFTGGLDLIGVALGLLSGLTYGLYSIFGKAALKKYSGITVTLWTFICASAVTVPAAAIGGGWPELSVKRALLLVSMALVSGAFTYTFYTLGLSNVEPTHASILASIEPVVAAVCGVLFNGEPMHIVSVIGILLVVAAVVVMNTKPKAAEEKASEPNI